MIFTELRFLAFFAAVLCIHWALPSDRLRKVWLLLCSALFYAAWDWRFLSLIAVSTIVDYTVARRLQTTDDQRARQALLAASLAANLGMLGFFKYFGFFVDSAAGLLRSVGFEPHLPSLSIVLPVGISFFTFQTLSYTIDVYRRQLEARDSLLDVALFVAFFPQLVAGPIVRAAAFLPQLEAPRRWRTVALQPLLGLFLLGFVKKACIADNVAGPVDVLFASPEGFTALATTLGVVLYAIQIYCDFSGYSDMAIATAGLLGYNLGPNFDFPYLAGNLREFWRRWHISLSTWLRDYLYFSLGGSRNGATRTAINLMLTMLLGGLWHGAAWRFVLWGGLHGLGLAIVRWWQSRRTTNSRSSGATSLLGWLTTMLWVSVGWILFRAQDLDTAGTVFGNLLAVGSEASRTLNPLWWVVAIGFFGAHLAMSRYRLRKLDRLHPIAFGCLYGVAIALALQFVHPGAEPFIYFQF